MANKIRFLCADGKTSVEHKIRQLTVSLNKQAHRFGSQLDFENHAESMMHQLLTNLSFHHYAAEKQPGDNQIRVTL